MKLAIASVVLSTTQSTRLPRQTNSADRRYQQLMSMIKFHNPDFDERKYFVYGCNCLMLGKFRAWETNLNSIGDRPLSDPGHGKSVDALDSVCKAYKNCLKCARMTYGNQCIAEFVKYNYGLQDEVVCKDNSNSCERALCECDSMFAKQHVEAKDVFSTDYHMIMTQGDRSQLWNPIQNPNQCLTSG